MINLENVSTNKFIEEQKQRWGAIYWYAQELLKKHNIRDYQQLKDFLSSNAPELDRDGIIRYLNSELNHIEKLLNRVNNLGTQPQIFTFDSFQSEEIDGKTISITDERNRGKVLLTTNPISLNKGIDSLRKLPISEIKQRLSHVDGRSLKNELHELTSISPKKIEGVVSAVKFYDEQVLRQFLETEQRDINLFFLNKAEKRAIVESQTREIAEYIVDNADKCIWGTLSDLQKRAIMQLSLTERSKKIQDSFINTISNYTTLGELEKGILSEQEIPTVIGGVIKRERRKPIDRFIVR